MRSDQNSCGLLTILVILCVVGCGGEKETLFEEEHERPAHWPSGPLDAAEKIRGLLDTHGKQAESAEYRSQLLDLVEWAPEIAADTDLSESDWNPIHDTSEMIQRHLRDSKVEVANVREDFDRLAELLERAGEVK